MFNPEFKNHTTNQEQDIATYKPSKEVLNELGLLDKKHTLWAQMIVRSQVLTEL
jgi:hypothetical protein